ncbi:MAG: PIG-L family deacetylase [Candidatus Eisenbacteria bacterium]|uniref:PIG-L family deacetylase n=1 Tax=Eiseniibacteriota bacterium TaxID=2212470 RepID=A0A948W8T7_UNCEI|nr:PIG-L family deacetylase [Candidatus Eisenbacteria bacterium]
MKETPCDVVVFGPHPDDAEMVMAGTMIRMVRCGYRVLNVSLTRGEMGTYGDVETRREEFLKANALMGTEGVLLDFPDTGVVNDREGRLKIASFVRKQRPRVVFAPYHTNPYTHLDGSANVDHSPAGELVRDGLKLARFRRLLPELTPHNVQRIFYYMIPKDHRPTFVVDVSDLKEEIHAAIKAYATQMSIHREQIKILDMLDAIRAFHGLRIDRPLAEAFLSEEALKLEVDDFFHI